MSYIEIRPEDCAGLTPLLCAVAGEPWTSEAESLAQLVIRGALDVDSHLRALAVVDGDRVLSLIAWRPMSGLPTWDVPILATDRSVQGSGLGTELLEAVGQRATDAGMRGLYLLVRPGNAPMLDLIATYRGTSRRADEQDTHLVCAIPLPLRRAVPFEFGEHDF